MGRNNRIRWEDMDKSKSDIQVALAAIQQAKALKSARTQQWYQSNITTFRGWLVEAGYPTTLSNITADMVRGFLAEEASRRFKVAYRRRKTIETGEYERYRVELPGRLSEHSLNTKIRCLRSFGRWLVREKWIADSPFEGLELAGAPKLRKKVLSEDEINRLFSMFNDKTDIGARDKAILWLFLDTGIRLSELATLTLDSINLTDENDGPWVQVIGKDRKERRIGLSAGACNAVRHYVEFFRPECLRYAPKRSRELEARGIKLVETPLFLTVEVRGIDRSCGQQLLPNAIQLIIVRLGQRAGIRGLSCHTFRRTFATQNLELGASPLDIMWDLGHSSLTMTNYYASLADQNRMRRHRQFSYMERMARNIAPDPSRRTKGQQDAEPPESSRRLPVEREQKEARQRLRVV